MFKSYEQIAPLTVKGFGHNLSATAIGRGTIRLRGQHNNHTSTILLTNILHIPAAQTNLISGVQLDRAGVISTLGHHSIVLSKNNKTILSGSVINDMYHLNLVIIPPKTIPLASRLKPATLASWLEPKPMQSNFYTASWGT
jgi:hypothetical protein